MTSIIMNKMNKGEVALKRILSIIISVMLLAMLSVGVAWAKPGGGGGKGGSNGSSSGTQASTHISKNTSNGTEAKVTKNSGQLSSGKNTAVRDFKQKLNTYNSTTTSSSKTGSAFTDIKEHWAKSNIEKMSAIGLFKGYEDGTFQPDETVTQAEAVSLIMRIASDAQTTDTTTTTTTTDTTTSTT